jgi:regulator of protease activity HflC (stomatin/prohibitin superfamily)
MFIGDGYLQGKEPELKEIDPPKDVQETMNKVVKAENEKNSGVGFRQRP